MPVTETLELERQLEREVGLGPQAVVVNALLPRRLSATDLDRVAEARPDRGAPHLDAAIEAALSQDRRAHSQQLQLRRLRRGTDAPVLTLPQILDGDLGREGVDRLALELARKL
jgi:hypothetical protein